MNGTLPVAIRFTLAITVGSTLLLLLVDHVLPNHLLSGFWILSVAMIYLWSIPALYLLAPLCVILLLVPMTRKSAGLWPLFGNIAASILLAVAIEHSNIFVAMMYA